MTFNVFSAIIWVLTVVCGGDIMKSNFGARPKSNVQAMKLTTKNNIKNTIIDVAFPTAIIGSLATAIALPVYFSSKSERERRQREEEEKKKILESRGDAIKKSNGYIKNLAAWLEKIIPLSNQGLFNSLIECKENNQLRDWQYEVVRETSNGNLNSKTLEKIIDELCCHWSKVYEKEKSDRNWISNKINGELKELHKKFDIKRQEEFFQVQENHLKEVRKIKNERLKIERERLEIERERLNNQNGKKT